MCREHALSPGLTGQSRAFISDRIMVEKGMAEQVLPRLRFLGSGIATLCLPCVVSVIHDSHGWTWVTQRCTACCGWKAVSELQFSSVPRRSVAFTRMLYLTGGVEPLSQTSVGGRWGRGEEGVSSRPGRGLFMALRFGLPLVSCKSAVAMPSVKAVYTRRDSSIGAFFLRLSSRIMQ